MAFAQTSNTNITRIGSKKLAFGSFTNGGSDTGGSIATGLSYVETAWVQKTGAAVDTNYASVNNTFPLASGTITVVTTADTDGQWFAIGR